MKQRVSFETLMSQDSTLPHSVEKWNSVEREKFQGWLIGTHQPMGFDHARNLSYLIGKILREHGNTKLSPSESTSLATKIILSDYSKSNKRLKLIALEYWMEYISTPIHFKKPQETKRSLKYLKEEQLVLLIRNASNYRDAAIIEVFCTTGIRLSELSGLNFVDIDFENNVIHIRHGKGDKEREVYMTCECKRFLTAYLENWDIESRSGPFFRSIRGTRYSNHAIGEMIRETAERAGLPHTTPHVLRHSYATCYASKTNDVFVLQELMGHSTLDMTKRYYHATREVKFKSAMVGAPNLA